MGKFVCSVSKNCYLELSVDSDNDIELTLDNKYFHQIFYLDKSSAQKLANELNQLLMEGKGSE